MRILPANYLVVFLDSELHGMPTSDAFRKMVNEVPIGIYEIDFDGSKFRYANPRFAEALGYSVDEILAKRPLDLLSDNSKKKFEYATRKIFQEKRAFFSDEFEAVGKNGKKMWGLSRVIVNYKQEKPDSLLVFAQDITERKRLEEELQLSEEKFSKAFSNSAFAVSLTCLSDGKIVEANESAASLFGFKREEVIGRTTLELQMWANPEDRHKFIQDLASIGNIRNRELSFRRRDGAIFLVMLSASMIEIQGEKHFLSTFIDITERKKIEEDLKMTSTIFDLSSDSIIVADLKGNILRFNDAACKMRGYTREEMAKLKVNDLNAPESAELLESRFKHLVEKGSAFFEAYHLRKDKSLIPVEIHASIIEWENKKLIAAIHRDMTERRKTEENIRFLSSAFDLASDSIFLVEPGGKILRFNQSAYKRRGFSPEELSKMSFHDLVVPRLLESTDQKISGIQAKGEVTFETIDKLKNGSEMPVEVNARLVTINGKKMALCVVRDISERKVIEEKLRENERLYRTLFDNSEDGFMLLELLYSKEGIASDFRFLTLNNAYEKQTGTKASDVLGRRASEVVPELNKLVIPLSDKVAKTGNSERLEIYDKYSKKWYDGFYFLFAKNEVGILFRDITQRKKAEDRLKESQKKFQDLVENINDLVWEMDAQGRYTYISPQVEKLWGTKPSEMIGKSFFDIMPPVEKEKTLEIFKKVSKYQGSIVQIRELQTSAYDRQGHLIYIETNGVPFFDKEGRLLGFRGVTRDITERKKAEDTLLQTQGKLQGIIDQSPLIFEVYDKAGFLIQVNNAWDRLWHIPRELALEKYNILTSKQVIDNGWRPYFERVYAGETVRLPELQFDASQEPEATGYGRKRWLSITAYPIKDGSGNVTGIVVLNEDITERRKAQEALKESESRFLSLFEQSPLIFGIYDKKGYLVQVNPAWDSFWQVPREDFIGIWNPLHSKQVMELGWVPKIQRAYSGESVVAEETLFDPSLEPEAHGKGKKRWLRTTIFPIKDAQGNVANIVMIHSDISEKKELEKELKNKERLSAIGATAGMVGHDIRNPLQAVIGETFLLKEELTSEPESEKKEAMTESLETIEKNIAYINKIVQDLQDYARPITPEIKEANLSEIFVSIFETIRLPDRIKLNINTHYAEKIRTDPMLVQRALSNLVNNAIQAMPNGGELKITGQPKDNRLVITIADTGTGIPEEIKPKLFTPMMTTKAKGQGFGLAVSKRLIEAMKGTISFESEEGKGTKFIIELPITQ